MTTEFAPAVAAPAGVHAGRLFLLRGAELAVVRTADAVHVPTGDAAPVDAGDDRWLYLGAHRGEPCFARALIDGDALPADCELAPLRALFDVLSADDFAIAGRALGLTVWDRDHRWCGRCGTPTTRSATERSRTCPACALAAYPRISPAMIVLVERDGKALLARNGRFPVRFHSCLAGFVELGESLEETVVREVREEVGVEVTDVCYAGSQPWPLTSSLMIGFTARWAAGELAPDGTEIAEAGWYAPDELPPLPGKLSIARALIDAWAERQRAT